MTTALSILGIQETGRFAFVTASEERTLETIRGLFDLENEDERARAWATLPRKDAAALMLVMMLVAIFDEDVICKLREDLTDCHQAGCTNPTIIVCSQMEGDAAGL
ncbi:MAG: hypothetical protein IID41_10935 [Planctomycetes bacterium]|nr:hypothetical protein [Planctomycetota bacterium]